MPNLGANEEVVEMCVGCAGHATHTCPGRLFTASIQQ